MQTLRRTLAALLITVVAAPAAADPIREAAERSARRAAAAAQMPTSGSGAKPMLWTGAALFAGGMSVGLYAFINNQNGSFAEFGEANAVNKKLGAAGIAAAFAGGTLLFMGTRRVRRAAPTIAITPTDVTVSKQISW